MKSCSHRLATDRLAAARRVAARRVAAGAAVLVTAACATTPDPDVSVQGGATAGTPAVGGTATTVAAGGSTTGGSASGTAGSAGGATGTTDATGTPTAGAPTTRGAGAGAADTGDASGAASGRNLAGGTPRDEPESPEQMFTDARIAAVASASNQDEIQTSRLAVERAQDQQVKAYAQRMITEHTALEQRQLLLLQQKGLAPQDNALSLQLTRNLQPTLDSLRAKRGAEFDLEYVLHQISSHKTTLQTLDTSLIPQARDAQMRAMLQEQVRPAVAQHLAEAMRLHHAMAQRM